MTNHRPLILAILHQAHSQVGHVGTVLDALGYDIQICRPLCGDPLPDSVAPYAAVIIFGGPKSADDKDLRPEMDWLSLPLKADIPYLGICLGGQLLARYLGGEARKDPKGRVEIGYHPIKPTEAGLSLLPWPEKVYQWHGDNMIPPDSCSWLAEGPDHFPCQAFIMNERVSGIQFHPDVTLPMLKLWCNRSKTMHLAEGAEPIERQPASYSAYNDRLHTWFNTFTRLWLSSALTPFKEQSSS